MKGFPTSADIYLELDGRKIAVVQSYRAKAAKSSKNVEAFGESEPVATIEGQKSYTVELTRLYGHRHFRRHRFLWADGFLPCHLQAGSKGHLQRL